MLRYNCEYSSSLEIVRKACFDALSGGPEQYVHSDFELGFLTVLGQQIHSEIEVTNIV